MGDERMVDDMQLHAGEPNGDAVSRACGGPVGVQPSGKMAPVEAANVWAPAMMHALDEARRALATGDVPVGAVVLDEAGSVLGRGRNQREATSDPTAHAEVVALREAAAARGSWRLEGCTLVVTLEPCTMCAGALVAARLDRLVYAADDPKAGAAGSLWDVVRDRRLNHRPEVLRGLGAHEASALLRDFFLAQRGT